MLLTEKQRRFVEAYMGAAQGNATEAARLAGYKGSRRTLESVGHQNLRKPEIRVAIDERAASDPAVADREVRQRFWSGLMQDDSTDLRWRLKASELLGRAQGDFIERRIIESIDDERMETPAPVHDYSKLSTEELRTLRGLMFKARRIDDE